MRYMEPPAEPVLAAAADDADVPVAVVPLVDGGVPDVGGVIGVVGGVVVADDCPGGAGCPVAVVAPTGAVVLVVPAAPVVGPGWALVRTKPLSGTVLPLAPGLNDEPLFRSLPCLRHPT
jgi:hypothetical protein